MPQPTQVDPDRIFVKEAAEIRDVSRFAIHQMIKAEPKRLGAKMNRRGRWTLSRALVEGLEYRKPGIKTRAK